MIMLLEYDPSDMLARWKINIDIECQNLSKEQKELACKIIDAHRGNNTGMSEFNAMLNDLAKVGFGGEIQHLSSLPSKYRLLLNSKIENNHKSD